jgi:protein tyrosine/serine phosphatase
MSYLEKNWLDPSQKLQVLAYKLVDGGALHNLRINVLNQKGLVGLNEAILEIGKQEMLQALQAITIFLESSPDDTVIVHCVQGKDRTGLLAMLCQSILGLSDEAIIEEYHLSESLISRKEGSAAAAHVEAGKIDRQFFTGAPATVMELTLKYLRDKYGSIFSYLDVIGFDAEWRKRLSAMASSVDAPVINASRL